ncbi:hypothetical protein NDU88_000980 [Pleurodeles waltl]|uniref:Uncharacterized protein n=1 Tax=Pleurodeles waltl TaxID=8319 RepID=A0AAV7Q4P7_PLEWA|nr:hypothetical protein NDU88_000980 [Pleurodeles waltl]
MGVGGHPSLAELQWRQGQIVISENENVTFVEEDGSVKLKGRSHNGNHADREAFKTYAVCKELAFMVERQSYFNYETECDSVPHIMDPLDPKRITGRWHMVARASSHPTLIYDRINSWVEFSWQEKKLKIREGHGNSVW